MAGNYFFKERLFFFHNPLNWVTAHPPSLCFKTRYLPVGFLFIHYHNHFTLLSASNFTSWLDFSIGSSINTNKHTRRASALHAYFGGFFFFMALSGGLP